LHLITFIANCNKKSQIAIFITGCKSGWWNPEADDDTGPQGTTDLGRERDRALIGIMAASPASNAVINMKVRDYFVQGAAVIFCLGTGAPNRIRRR
jgi:hypothetical protein